MTGSGPLCRKANPLAAPSAIFTLLDHGRGTVPSKRIRVFYYETRIKKKWIKTEQLVAINYADQERNTQSLLET